LARFLPRSSHSHSTAAANPRRLPHRAALLVRWRASMCVIPPAKETAPAWGRVEAVGGLLCPEVQAQWATLARSLFTPARASGLTRWDCNRNFTNLRQTWVAGISGPDHGNTSAAKRSYSALAALCVSVAYFESASGQPLVPPLRTWARSGRGAVSSAALLRTIASCAAAGFSLRLSLSVALIDPATIRERREECFHYFLRARANHYFKARSAIVGAGALKIPVALQRADLSRCDHYNR
jgi:hypothetical protein